MSELVKALTAFIKAELSSKVGAAESSHYRGAFSGPTTEILEEILEVAVAEGGFHVGPNNVHVPVLLPARNVSDPTSLTSSGRCTDSHLVKVRTCDPRLLVLLPPGYSLNESIATTIQQFGIAPDDRRPAYRTALFDDLVIDIMDLHFSSNREQYIQIARWILKTEHARLDEDSKDNWHQWSLLRQLFDQPIQVASSHDRTLAILGLLSCAEGRLDADSHYEVLGPATK